MFRPHYWRRRRPVAGVAFAGLVLALMVAGPPAKARTPEEPTAPCPTAGALVVYTTSQGVAYRNDLVIRPDGHASLCWSRPTPAAVTGRTTFVLTRRTLAVLHAELDRIDVEHLGPPPAQWPPCCYQEARALVYDGTGIPFEGRPQTPEAIQALNHVHAMLGRIIVRHEPELI